jgi:hypothetical protein
MFATDSESFAIAKTHRYHLGGEENSRLSLVDKILEIKRHCVANDKSEIWFEHLTCLWTDANHPKVFQVKRGIPDGYGYDNFIAVS